MSEYRRRTPLPDEAVVRPEGALPTVQPNEVWAGKIRVIEELAPGGMSHIVRAADVALQRELVLKVSPAPRDEMPRPQLARFIEEAQITAQLEHPNVVPVHDLGLDPEGRVYFAMKYVRGQSLEQILTKRRKGDEETVAEFGLRRLLDVFLQVCLAIEYAHARGVVHRDLKPANIMVGDFGEVLVMDWGIAKLMAGGTVETTGDAPDGGGEARRRPSSHGVPPTRASDITSLRAGEEAYATQAGTLIGTPAYMSPEQASARAVDQRSDIYSLGAILYEILCGDVPFEDDDAHRMLRRVLTEEPRPPSDINPAAPHALETLALRLLEKDPEKRTLTLPQIRGQIQDYIEGIGRDYRVGTLWSNVLWTAGALSLFAFLVWYLTGESISALFALAPATVLNAVGWFLVILALGTPLWSAYVALRIRRRRDRFSEPTATESFVSGYFAHRSFATVLAPVSQLLFLGEIAWLAVAGAAGEGMSAADVERLGAELRAQWAQSLIVILIFLFAYLFFLSSEVRWARRLDRYQPLVARPRWEAVWPFLLIFLLLFTIGTTHALDWVLAGRGDLDAFVQEHVLTQPLDLVEIAKTLVFQGTFLTVLVLGALLLSFPLAEVLAALRLPFQPADEAAVRYRAKYFIRSVAIFRVLRINWLYGGAVIGALTAMTVLSRPVAQPMVVQVLYILGPSLVGFVGYAVTRRQLQRYLRHAPAVARLLAAEVDAHRDELTQVTISRLARVPWAHRLAQLVVPFACLAVYLLVTESGIHERAVEQLVMPMTGQGWLLILPYLLLIPILLVRDSIHLRVLQRRRPRPPAAD
ncbi:MAG TPA: serine/threonine-protein kinase [Kofleriaceae bacterium]|nr:serine/threonine-protein kinase [Kofleriaceae bacterium]